MPTLAIVDPHRIFDENMDLVKKVCNKYGYYQSLRVFDRDDFFQEGYLLLWRLCNKFQNGALPTDIRSWLAVCLRYCYKDFLRYNRKRELPTWTYPDVLNAKEENQSGFHGDEIELVQKALKRIPDDARILLEQVYFLDKPMSEVETLLKCCRSEACRKLKKALNLVARELGAKDFLRTYEFWQQQRRLTAHPGQKQAKDKFAQWRKERVDRFLADCCEMRPEYRQSRASLYAAFLAFDQEGAAVTHRHFSHEMAPRFPRARSNGTFYLGLRLKPPAPPPEAQKETP